MDFNKSTIDLKEFGTNQYKQLQKLFSMGCTCFNKYTFGYNAFFKLIRNDKLHYSKIKSLSGINESALILDVGGGTGLIAEFFVDGCKKVTVLDPSEKMLSKVKSEKIVKIVGDCQKIPFEDETFDLVYCVDAMHHFTNGLKKEEYNTTTEKNIKEMLRVLKNDGSLIVVEFDIERFWGKIFVFLENSVMRWGSRFFSRTELKNLFEKQNCNAEIFDLDYLCYVAKITKK